MSGKSAAEVVTLESTAGEGENVAKALEHVASIVSTVKAALSPAAASGEIVEEDLEKARKGTFGALMKAMFPKKSEYDTMMSKMTKDFGLDANAKFQNQQPPVAKAKKPAEGSAAEEADESPDEAAAEGDEPKKPAKAKKSEPALEDPIDMLMSAISKANDVHTTEKAKHLTKARVEKLKQAAEILKVMIQDIEQGAMPKSTVAAGAGLGSSGIKDLESPMEQPVIKSKDELAEIISKAVIAATEPLRAELEAVKKAKPSSNGLEPTTETKQVAKSMWGGVL